jgi:hypothetical protein
VPLRFRQHWPIMAPQSAAAAGAVPVDPNESLSGSIIACVGVMFAASTVSLGLRFYVRGRLLRAIAAEDWCILAAWVSSRNQAFVPVELLFPWNHGLLASLAGATRDATPAAPLH